MKFGIYTLMLESNLRKIYEFDFGGWGNGYVLLPPNHPFYNKNYDNINVDIHGGLTFGQKVNSEYFLKWIENKEVLGDVTIENFKKFNDYWIIGFDTNHSGDNITKCSKDYVIDETNSLLEQCLDNDIEGIKKYKYIYLRKDKLKVISSLK